MAIFVRCLQSPCIPYVYHPLVEFESSLRTWYRTYLLGWHCLFAGHKHTYEHTRTLKSLVWLWPSQFSDLFIGTLIRCLFLILNCRSLEPPSQICPFHLSILLIDHFHRYWSRTEQTSPHHNKLINLIQSSNDDLINSRPTKINKITKCYDTMRLRLM